MITERDNTTLTLYHGSDRIVLPENIRFPGPRGDCDFGTGFYLTDSRHVAEEWVCNEQTPIINVYNYTVPQNDVLYLVDTDWLRVIVGFRKEIYKVHLKSNVVHGLIADDRMFEYLADFIRGAIGDKRLMKCLDYCKLGSQYCLRKDPAGLTFVNSYPLQSQERQNANQRFKDRRIGMRMELQQIIRRHIEGERFIEDYLQEGDFFE